MTDLTFCDKTTFYTVCKLLEQICYMNSREKKIEIMKKFISSFREHSQNHQNDSFYQILRLILPQIDNERGPYGIKENTLAKIYIRILCLSKTSKDAQKLLNYKSPKNSISDTGDFAEIAYQLLRSRFSNEESLNIYQVNAHLDCIATNHANHNQRGVDNELKVMILRMSSLEQKWLIRILLKDLHLGLSHVKILNIFHEDANDLFDVTNNLQKVCTVLKDPSIRLNEIQISLFEFFKPMLCQMCDIQSINCNIKKLEYYYVEIKFDGERFQLHYQNGEFKYFSRNGFDYTNTYGCNGSNGILTPKLVKSLSSKIENCILDGEMMCWNTLKKSYTTKGMNTDVKNLKTGQMNQPCFCVFDIIYLNGEVLTNKSLSERIKILNKMILPQEGVLMKSNQDVVKSSDEIINLLKLSIDNCEEGIVVKDPFSIYKPNSRKAGWYKIKPEYIEGMMVELDLIIIGGYYGEGRRRGLVSQFLLGLADSKKNGDNEPFVFYSLGRVGSGCKDDELAELDGKLRNSWQEVKQNQMPPGIYWTREKPDLWIKPRSSFILEIKATEIIPSDSFALGYTLRFPRIQRIRYDKLWSECLTVDEFTSIKNSSNGKLTAAYATKLSQNISTRKTKRVKNTRNIDNRQLYSNKTKDVELLSTLFKNLEFCILMGDANSLFKNELEIKIIQNGGIIVQNPRVQTNYVIATDITVRVSNIIQLNKYDVVKPNWLLECIENNAIRKCCTDDFLFMSPATCAEISQKYDCFGDSYTEPIDLHRLKQILNFIKIEENFKINIKKMINLDKMLFDKENPYAIFRGCFAYFYTGTNICKNKCEIYKAVFKFYGGCEKEKTDEQTTHFISFVDELPIDLMQQLEIQNILVVNENWISKSADANSRLNESGYIVKICLSLEISITE